MILSSVNSLQFGRMNKMAHKANEDNSKPLQNVNVGSSTVIKDVPSDLDSFFSSLPKAELHAHLAGSYPLNFVRKQLKEKGMSDPDIQKATYTKERYENLTDFVNVYTNLSKSVQTPDELKAATYGICMDAAKENVKYLELKISSQELNPALITDEKERIKVKDVMYHAINEGINQSKEELKRKGFNQTVKLMVTTERHESPETSMEDAKLAVKWSKEPNGSVVALDLAGDELNFSIDRHAKTLKYAKDNGLHLTIHAGETPHSEKLTPTESMFRAIAYGTERIGHGLALFNDKKLLQAVKDKNITIENCPSSNVAIGSTTWDKKHLKRMIDENVRVSVNTDDLSMFNTNMTEEFRRLYKHGIITTWKDFKTLIKNSIEGSFAPAQEKKQLETDFDNELNLIESDPKAKAVIDKYLTSTNNAFHSMFDKLKNLKNSNK